MAGAPNKYNKKTLDEAVKKYFDSISCTVTASSILGEPALNELGEEIKIKRYLVPPTVSGLCIYLGIDRSTWSNYCSEEKHPEFQSITNYAKIRLESYLEEELLTRKKGVQGIIFNLQNNYGWKNKSEIEIGEETRKSAQSSNMSMREKLELITHAAKAIEQSKDEEAE